MKQNQEQFELYYANENDENLRGHYDKKGIIEFLTTEKYMKQLIPPNSKILDACAGCGVYSFFLANEGHIVTAGDFVEHNVNEIIKKQKNNPVLHQIYTGSAANLSRFCDKCFDVVLNMGAYYHITDKYEREQSILECLRVLKKNGLFFMSYINKFSNIILYHEKWRDDFTEVERAYINDDSLFYQSTPEEIESVMEKYGLKIIHNIATDGLSSVIADTVNQMSNEVFERYMKYHFQTCETKSILGYSNHALVICRYS